MAFGGHYCTYIPYDKKACDHLETSLFPIETLGTEYIVSMPYTPHGEHQWVRILGLYDNTKVVFCDPPVSGRNGAVINTGEVLELPDVASSFAILANGKVFVTQYMLGEYDTVPDGGTPTPDLGDPSESAAITLTQYRSSYTFLAPQTYTENWIDVLAPIGATVVSSTGWPFRRRRTPRSARSRLRSRTSCCRPRGRKVTRSTRRRRSGWSCTGTGRGPVICTPGARPRGSWR